MKTRLFGHSLTPNDKQLGRIHLDFCETICALDEAQEGSPLRSQGHCFSRPQVTRSLFFMRKLKQHRSQVVFLNCRGRAVALKMAPGRRSRKTPLGPLGFASWIESKWREEQDSSRTKQSVGKSGVAYFTTTFVTTFGTAFGTIFW